MAVLIEAVSVVIRREAMSRKCPGRWPACVADLALPSLCADNVLAALSFWEPADADACIEFLVRRGLVHLHHGSPVDIEIVDQTQGCRLQVPWCEVIAAYTTIAQTLDAIFRQQLLAAGLASQAFINGLEGRFAVAASLDKKGANCPVGPLFQTLNAFSHNTSGCEPAFWLSVHSI